MNDDKKLLNFPKFGAGLLMNPFFNGKKKKKKGKGKGKGKKKKK